MATEAIRLRARGGAVGPGEAEVVRYGAARRLVHAATVLGAGGTIGLGTVLIPVVHLIAPWAVLLLAGAVAAYVARVGAWVGAVRGRCPACAAAVAEPALGTVGGEAVWLRCAGCGGPLELLLEPR